MIYSNAVDNIVEIYVGKLSDLPSGWYLCDGNKHNGVQTPNLQDYYLYGSTVNTSVVNHTLNGNNTISDNATLPAASANDETKRTTVAGGAHNHNMTVTNGVTAIGDQANDGAHGHYAGGFQLNNSNSQGDIELSLASKNGNIDTASANKNLYSTYTMNATSNSGNASRNVQTINGTIGLIWPNSATNANNHTHNTAHNIEMEAATSGNHYHSIDSSFYDSETAPDSVVVAYVMFCGW